MLILADARQLPLADGCVNCVVTSPPYYGLRSYATATWIGGDISCGHIEQRGGRDPVNVCKKCGAQRIDKQIGLEETPDQYVASLVAVFREVRRVLKDDGTAWLNLGDSYASSVGAHGNRTDNQLGVGAARTHADGAADQAARIPSVGFKAKDLIGIPWRVAFALQADGWYLRSDIIWHKKNPMPESVTDRPTKSHEYVFLLTKAPRYYYDAQAIAEPVSEAMYQQVEQGYDGLGLKDYAAAGVQNPSSVKARIIAKARHKSAALEAQNARHDGERLESLGGSFGCSLTPNKRSVWTIPSAPFTGAHFATMPPALVEPCILAGCPAGGLVLDPFCGSGTVLEVAQRLGRRAVGTDLGYHDISRKRTAQRGLLFTGEQV